MYISDTTHPYKGFPGQPGYNSFATQFTEVEKYKVGHIPPLPDTLWEASSPAEGDEEGFDIF